MNSKLSKYSQCIPYDRSTPSKSARNRSHSTLTSRKPKQANNNHENEIAYIASELKTTQQSNITLQNENMQLQKQIAKLSHDKCVTSIDLQVALVCAFTQEKIQQLEYELAHQKSKYATQQGKLQHMPNSNCSPLGYYAIHYIQPHTATRH